MTDHEHGLDLIHVAVMIPHVEGSDRWFRFAVEKMVERFGVVNTELGFAQWVVDGRPGYGMVSTIETLVSDLTELDQSILMGIAWTIYQALGEPDGVCVKIADDVLIL